MAKAGLSLLDEVNAEGYITESIQSIEYAVKLCKAKGIVMDGQRILNLMKLFDSKSNLLPLFQLVDSVIT